MFVSRRNTDVVADGADLFIIAGYKCLYWHSNQVYHYDMDHPDANPTLIPGKLPGSKSTAKLN